MRAEGRLPPCYRQVVVDTNVIISAVLSPRGAPAQLLKRFFREGQWVFSAATFAELKTRLITGDDDLLCLDPLNALRILTPRAALDELTA